MWNYENEVNVVFQNGNAGRFRRSFGYSRRDGELVIESIYTSEKHSITFAPIKLSRCSVVGEEYPADEAPHEAELGETERLRRGCSRAIPDAARGNTLAPVSH